MILSIISVFMILFFSAFPLLQKQHKGPYDYDHDHYVASENQTLNLINWIWHHRLEKSKNDFGQETLNIFPLKEETSIYFLFQPFSLTLIHLDGDNRYSEIKFTFFLSSHFF